MKNNEILLPQVWRGLRGLLGNPQMRMIKRLFAENFRNHYPWYAIAIAAMVVTAAMTAASAWIMREIVNSMVVNKDAARVFVIAALVAVIFTVKGLSTYVQNVFLSKAGNSIIADQQRKVFDRILDSDVAFIQSKYSSEILLRVTHAAQSARSVIDTIVVSFVRDSFTLIGLLLIMFIQQPILSLFTLVSGPLALIGLRFLLNRIRKIAEMEMTSIAEIIRIVQEASAGFKIIKSYALENYLRRDMQTAISNVEDRANAIARIEAATSPMMETLGGLAIAGAIALSAFLVLGQDQGPGALASFVTALLLAYEPAKRLARMRVQIETGMVGVRMLFDILDHPIALKDKPGAEPLRFGRGEVTFDKVDFSYRDGEPVLKELSFSFEPGKVTALVGPSGSGKSTVTNLILRLYDPDSGRILINGQDIRDVTLKSLREQIAYVGQESFLFSGSVRHNIQIGRADADEADVIKAAKSAYAHEFIVKLPHGYDTQLGENGHSLSGGQKQRLTIARAFMRNTGILVLDEATSALDSEAELEIRRAIDELSRGRTTIVIAHRMSTIAQADHIFVLDGGVIVEQGPPGELLKNEGRYRRLYENQLLPTPG